MPKKLSAKPRTSLRRIVTPRVPRKDFDVVLTLIDAARSRAVATVNTALIDLYWSIGKHIARKIASDGWGQRTVAALAAYIQKRTPNARGFSPQNLWRMRQFFDTYRRQAKLSARLRELPWTHNLLIMSRSKRDDERAFYLRMAHDQKWTSRELERQLNGSLFERIALSPAKLSAPLRELHPDAISIFKDTYLLDFLNLSKTHAEADLHRALIERLKDFLIELGHDFCFVGSHYPLQVGAKDFELDLLFYHRGLTCLVAFELKIEEFQPEHLGKLAFYLEALDRNIKKPNEKPTIGVLLCATKNHEVVEYSLSRTIAPAVVAEYHTHLPDKRLLRAKLHEFYHQAKSQAALPSPPTPERTRKHS